jgi:uncharacterized membrane protein
MEVEFRKVVHMAGVQSTTSEVVIREILEIVHRFSKKSVEELKLLEELSPGVTNQIMGMAHVQQRHEHWVQKVNALLPLFGIVAAVGVIAAMIVTAVYLAMNGHDWLAGAVFSGTGAAAVAGAFLQRPQHSAVAQIPQKHY